MAETTAGDLRHRFRALPLADLDSVIGGGTVLVLAPHADDELLGCGGLIAACCARCRPPVVAILTDGIGSHPNSRAYPPGRLRAVRKQEARDATTILGLPQDRLHFLGLRDTAAPLVGPEFDGTITALNDLMRANGCDMIAAPWRHDPHCDHEAADAMARHAARAGFRLLSYPVWGWTLPADTVLPDAPVQGWRLDIAAYLPAKRRAIAAHASQYGNLIDDDPTGFRLPPELLAVFDRPYEVFLDTL